MNLPISKEWKSSEGAALIKHHQKSRRAAWLWDNEGQELIWQNVAARLFRAKCKNHKLKLAKPVIPIPGQIRRLLRLGTFNLTSLARVRFLSGTKPVSATCSCTPVELENGETGLLIVAVDPIKAKFFTKKPKTKSKPKSTAKTAKKHASKKTSKKHGKKTDKTQKNLSAQKSSGSSVKKGQLSELTDRLANNSKLFEPLDDGVDDGEIIDPNNLIHRFEPSDKEVNVESETDHANQHSIHQWRISSEGFIAFKESAARPSGQQTDKQPTDHELDEQSMSQDITVTDDNSLAAESIEDVAQYNFEELGRILGEKVGTSPVPKADTVTMGDAPPSNAVSLSGEALVLNRLPVGILIFRDQDILFVNRALADLVDAPSISQLKKNGLAAIFPALEDSESAVGPVLSVMDSQGRAVEVDARLQSVNWQGAPALMLSAQALANAAPKTLQPTEDAAKSFVQKKSEARGEGYFELDRDGIVQKISEQGLNLLGESRANIVSLPLSNLINENQLADFQSFLEIPAKTAETRLPYFEMESKLGDLCFELFTQGNAGKVDGYFGTISAVPSKETENPFAPKRQGEVATLVLARLSRGIRRPLNTIMGFSELISAQSFGEISNKRYVEYAKDIQSAGGEIAQLTDELDEYARLEDQGIPPNPDSFDLTQLLDECVGLVRDQANRARVFVRSAISEDLPRVLADRKSLRQAMLNLLASAISQTPKGRKVILSAQIEDDQSVGVHVRDSSTGPSGIDDRFVVFQEKDRNGKPAMVPLKSSMGLALTRSLISVNSCALFVDPSAGTGTLMSLVIPQELLV